MDMKNFKIVVTGGPGGGKTTALDLFQRELRADVKIVPEAATVLFKCGLERDTTPDKQKLLQNSIYKMQLNLEEIYRNFYSERLLVCDRGTLDGLAYWPNSQDGFFSAINSTFEKEILRYDAVIFFQTAAAHAEDMKSNNPYRTEDAKGAICLDEKLKGIWEQHPNFHYIPSNSSFLNKITHGLLTIQGVLEGFKNRKI